MQYPGKPYPGKLYHAGLADVTWFQPDQWSIIEIKSRGRKKCSPARCWNPSECGIPDCTLVDFGKSWTYRKTFRCDTHRKQHDTSGRGCVPEKDRVHWPKGETNEVRACQTAFKRSNTGKWQLYSGWYLQPATRMVFCHGNYYTTAYSEFSPRFHAAPNPTDNQGWMTMDPFAFKNDGGWRMSQRGMFGFPFTSWEVNNVKTRNIIIFVGKRSLCKPYKGLQRCFAEKFALCWITHKEYVNVQYPSTVGSRELQRGKNMVVNGMAKKCPQSVLQKLQVPIQSWVAVA